MRRRPAGTAVRSITRIPASGLHARRSESQPSTFPKAGRLPLPPLIVRSIAQEGEAEAHPRGRRARLCPRGYHGSRVGDIAKEAGVAHGLVYHYFSSKEQVLETVFRENSASRLEGFRAVESGNEPARAKLEGIAKILLRTWRNNPDLVTVMMREVARSPQLQSQVEEMRGAFAIIQRVIEEGQADGTFRRDVDAAACELDRLRGPRGGAHRLGDRTAAGRRRSRRPGRADGHRAPRSRRAQRLGSRAVEKVFNLNVDEVGSHGGSAWWRS